MVELLALGLQALGAFQKDSARRTQAEYKSEVDRTNAIIAEQNAMDSIRRGQIEAARHGVRVRQTQGAAAATMAAAGLDISIAGEAAALMLEDLRVAGAYDILTIRHNAAMEARRALIQKAEFTASSDLLDMQAASIRPFVSALTTGVSAAVSYDLV